MITWLITGVSTGLGRAIADSALAKGDHVIRTLRTDEQCAAFAVLMPGRSFGVLLDVTDFDRIATVTDKIEREVGPVDILVNNAGYGHEGLIEESSIEELRRQFDVNVFGAVAMIKAVLPAMRKRRSGHIINVTSMGGIMSFAGLGFYYGKNFTLEDISETLGKQVKDLGIYVNAVAPGSFRTDWAERSIRDYNVRMNPIRERRQKISGNQPGDPAKLGAAVVQLVHSENPPAHLLLGTDAYRLVPEKLTALQAEIDHWKNVSLSTDFAT